MKKTSYTKASLIRELAASAEITQKKARFILDELTRIAYREAADGGFTVPGICHLDVVLRKPRRMKNPQTGVTILIGEHRTLRARIVKAARNAVTPPPEDLVTVLPDEGPTQAELEDFSNAISFCCKKCGQEIEAPRAAIGIEAHCPACGASIIVPAESEAGTLHGPALPTPTVPPAAPTTAAPETPPASPDATSASPFTSPPPQNRPPPPRNRLLRPRSPNRRHAAARRYGSTWRHWDSRRKSMPHPELCRPSECFPSSVRTAAKRSKHRQTWPGPLQSVRLVV